MTGDEPENILLRMLRQIDAKLDRIADDVRELKQRVGHLEEVTAAMGVQSAHLSMRIDRLDERLQRVERRLELAPA